MNRRDFVKLPFVGAIAAAMGLGTTKAIATTPETPTITEQDMRDAWDSLPERDDSKYPKIVYAETSDDREFTNPYIITLRQ